MAGILNLDVFGLVHTILDTFGFGTIFSDLFGPKSLLFKILVSIFLQLYCRMSGMMKRRGSNSSTESIGESREQSPAPR